MSARYYISGEREYCLGDDPETQTLAGYYKKKPPRELNGMEVWRIVPPDQWAAVKKSTKDNPVKWESWLHGGEPGNWISVWREDS